MISVVVPIYDEAESIPTLTDAINRSLDELPHESEVILVNDGSRDNSEEVLAERAALDGRLKVINLRRNFGQTAAMMAGIEAAQGETIILMDGDLQNDPADIPHILNKLNEGFDVVSGWRKRRRDGALRVALSRVANWLISRFSGVRLHDYGCTLKAYRREIIKAVRLRGEMHRFIPVYASWLGARVAELEVTHHPRRHGRSKYGLGRVWKVFLDLLVIKFLSSYRTKPIYVFGGAALACLGLSAVVLLFALYLKFFEGVSLILTPLPLLAAMAFLVGLMSFLMGLIAELLVRFYYRVSDAPIYVIKNTINLEETD